MVFWRDGMHYACVCVRETDKTMVQSVLWRLLAIFEFPLALASTLLFSPSGHSVLEIDRMAKIRNSILPFQKSTPVHRPHCRLVCENGAEAKQ